MSDAHDAPMGFVMDEILSVDTPCTSCGYNLRGMRQDQACPECGAEVWRSCQGNWLRYADPGWLEKLRQGVSLKLALIGIMIVAGFAMGALSAATTAAGVFAAPMIVWAVQAVLSIASVMLITSPEPTLSLEEQPVSLRRITRNSAFVSIASGIADLGILPLPNLWVYLAIKAVGVIAWVVWYFGEFVYLRRFALRIPDEKLAKYTRRIMWGLAVMPIVFGVTIWMSGVAGGPGVGTPGAAAAGGFLVVGCFAVVMVIVLALAYVRMLYRYKAAFKEAAELARQVDRPMREAAAMDTPPAP